MILFIYPSTRLEIGGWVGGLVGASPQKDGRQHMQYTDHALTRSCYGRKEGNRVHASGWPQWPGVLTASH